MLAYGKRDGKPDVSTIAWARTIAFAAFAVLLMLNVSSPGLAQSYPDKPIKLVVPFPAGGTVDTVARLISHPLAAHLGQSIVIENRPGAGTTIALKSVALADPDGYTLLLGSTGSLAINPSLYSNLDFGPVKRLVPVAMLIALPNVLVVSSAVPATSVSELVGFAKANPGKLRHGAALGAPTQLLGEFFRAKTGTEIVYVPYRGTAQVLPDLLSGEVQITCESLAILMPYIAQGAVRPLLVTSATRLPELPQVPTLLELGFDGYPVETWMGLVAPAATPQDVITKLNAAANAVMGSREMQSALKKRGFEARTGSAQDFAARIAREREQWAAVIKLTGARAD
jgi:tripartite-type tricarboxylate transporter receptor subunit TctC